MKVSSWSVRNPIPILVVTILCCLLGMYALSKLPVKRLPNVDFPLVSVDVALAGGTPDQLERQVTRPIEDALAGLPGVRHLESTVIAGSSSTTVEFEIGTDMQLASDSVRDAVERTHNALPQGIDPPSVRRVDMSAAPILTFAIQSSHLDDLHLSELIDDELIPSLRRQAGIAQVNRIGGMVREVAVTVDPARLAASGVTLADVDRAIEAIDADGGGGHALLFGKNRPVRIAGAATSVDQLRAIAVPMADGSPQLLGDLAEVREVGSKPTSYTWLDGRSALAVEVSKTSAASEVQVAGSAAEVLQKFSARHRGLRITTISSMVQETEASYQATVRVVLEGIALTGIVVFFFMRNWRSALVATLAMPLSLLPTFIVMWMLDFSLNIITLLALSLSIGILVDDAIVEIENIKKRIDAGDDPRQAAAVGGDAISLAVVATTMAIVAIFVPVSFMTSAVGQYFKEFGVTVAAAVICSLIVARFVTPLLCALLLKSSQSRSPRQPYTTRYPQVLQWTIRHPALTAGISALAFVLGIVLAASLPLGFQPAGDPGFVNINVAGPLGATESAMRDPLGVLQSRLRKYPEVSGVFARIGSTAAGRGDLPGSNTATDLSNGTVTVMLRTDRARSTSKFQDDILHDLRSIPNIRLSIDGLATNTQVEVGLAGNGVSELSRAQKELLREMRGLRSVRNPEAVPPASSPELVIVPDVLAASAFGVNSQDVARTVRLATGNESSIASPKLTTDQHIMPIRVRLPDETLNSVSDLADLSVPLANGGATRLSAVAEFRYADAAGRITRYDRTRRVSVVAQLANSALSTAMDEIMALPVIVRPPAGVSVVDEGDAESSSDLLSGFLFSIFFGILLSYCVLVLLFKSIGKPILIMSAIPFSIVGAFIVLRIFSIPTTLPVFIGILLLFGISAKNSILLVERVGSLEREGEPRNQAIIEAALQRARPILMTSVAMIAGMFPTALGLGEGAAFRQPMALAVVGGLISSTLLSLVLLPALYAGADRGKKRFRSLVGGRRASSTAPTSG